MEKTEKVMENHGIFCKLKSTNPIMMTVVVMKLMMAVIAMLILLLITITMTLIGYVSVKLTVVIELMIDVWMLTN